MIYQPMKTQSYASIEDYIETSKERHLRLRKAPPPVRKPIALPEPVASILIYRDKSQKDAHVIAWRKWLSEQGNPCKAYIKRRCLELGVHYDAVIGPMRLRSVVPARHLIMWEIKRLVKPSISYPELGRMFGGRDHTSTLHAVRKIDRMKERGEIE